MRDKLKFVVGLVFCVIIIVGASDFLIDAIHTSLRPDKMLAPSVRITYFNADGSIDRNVSGVAVHETKLYYYILTAKHAVTGVPEAGHFSIFDWRESEVGKPEVVATSDTRDLALLKISKGNVALKTVTLCRTEPEVFDEVYAVGAALGGPVTVSRGLISGVNKYNMQSEKSLVRQYLHTAGIYPGSSGGGMFDANKWCLNGINIAIGGIPFVQLLPERAYAVTLPDIKSFLSLHL